MKNLLLFTLFLFQSCFVAPAYSGTQTIIKADIIENTSTIKNYIGAKGHFEKSVNGVNAFADAAATTPVDMTGGSPNTTCTRTTSSPLSGEGSLLITKGGSANRQGEGCSIDFSIDTADKGKVLQGIFDFAIASGTYVSNDVDIWVYDVSNSTLIAVAPLHLLNHTLASDKFSFEFQTSSSSTSYRVGWFIASTSTSNYTISIDNVQIGRQAKLYGSPVSDWVDSGITTSTSGWQGFGTLASVSIQKRQVGDSLYLRGNFTAGTITSTEYRIPLPSGLTLKSTYVTPSPLGTIGFNAALASSTNYFLGSSAAGNAYLNLYVHSGTVGYSIVNTTGPMPASSSIFYLESGPIPIQGWSSSQLMSSDASTRVVAAYATGTTADVTSGNPIIPTTVTMDTHGAYNASTGRYTCPVSGFYQVMAAGANAASGVRLLIYKDAASQMVIGTINSSGQYSASGIIYANAGQVLDVRPNSNVTGFTNVGSLSFNLIQGPAQIMASETVAASYWVSSNFASSTTIPINFDSKEYDYWGAVTTSSTAWKFTAPISGLYDITTILNSASASYVQIYKGGNTYKNITFIAASGIATGTTGIRLLAGEYFDLRCLTSITVSGGTLSSNGTGLITIKRVGNY